MASLITHGDLDAPGPALTSRLYVRPVMSPHEFLAAECVPQDEWLVDLLHRAFHRMFEGDGQQPPAAPSVRIVNLSIGDPQRVFVRRLSPLAKLLDWLAYRYNLLVLVSAGNHDATTTVSAAALNDEAELARHVLAAARDASLRRRLLSPAEAVNVLTVGRRTPTPGPGRSRTASSTPPSPACRPCMALLVPGTAARSSPRFCCREGAACTSDPFPEPPATSP